MHHNTLKSAIKKYGALKLESPAILAAHIKLNEPDFSDDDANAVVEGIRAQVEDGEATKLFGIQYPSGRVAPAGKKLYDKWRGQWKAVAKIKNPFNGEEKVVKWQFEFLESAPNRTGIPLTEGEAELFNRTRKMAVAKVPTEQLVIHCTKPDVFYDMTPDFEPQAI